MKNNFVPSFPFHKKEQEKNNKNVPPFRTRNGQSSHEYTEKKISLLDNGEQNQTNFPLSSKQIQTTQQESRNSDNLSSCKSLLISATPNILELKSKQQRTISPLKYQNYSFFNSKQNTSPNMRETRFGTNKFIPVRATLKNVIQSKVSPNNKPQKSMAQDKQNIVQLQHKSSHRANKTVTQMFHSPLKSIERENQILREQNQLLRKELGQIKKNLLQSSGNKKEDLISNLRNTIKKQDSQIKELRLKIDIFTKKNAALVTLLENKDQQILFLSDKISEVKQEFFEQKQTFFNKFQNLKDRINFILKSYNDLEAKWNKAQLDWLAFKQKWMEEKSIYTHRISFLEEYIANN